MGERASIDYIVRECRRIIPEELGPFSGTFSARELSERTDLRVKQVSKGLERLEDSGEIRRVNSGTSRLKYEAVDESLKGGS